LLIDDGIWIRLPLRPSKPRAVAAFEALSAEERQVFYERRHAILSRLALGMGHSRTARGLNWVRGRIAAVATFAKDRIPLPLAPGAEIVAGVATFKPETGADFADAARTELSAEAATSEMGASLGTDLVDLESAPDELSEAARAATIASVTAFVDTLWNRCAQVARANGIGISIIGVVGADLLLWNHGIVKGRGFSIDVGVSFTNANAGYVRIFYEKLAKRYGVSGYRIGFRNYKMLHLLSEPGEGLDVGDSDMVTHFKSPGPGAVRTGQTYTAFGYGFTVDVADIAGAGLVAMGRVALATSVIAVSRGLGIFSLYSADVQRRLLWQGELSQEALDGLGLPAFVPDRSRYERVAAHGSPMRAQLDRSCGTFFTPESRH
jgi:hypothetical protein